MPGNPDATVYIGNLDEKVNDRVLYEIMIQAGQLIDFYIPRDKDTNRAKAYAFAEYETEEIADYAVRLFSGLVTLYNRTLKFAIAGQDRPNTISAPPMTTIASDSSPKLTSSVRTMQLFYTLPVSLSIYLTSARLGSNKSWI
ncbi:hypothetical protein MRB53_033888 [Persea americana]|uniref:Uncharacterized protein n=1 Tax=Persea americana TaxID=3435 RepID=A0ACC2KWL6_PERAE|nr:hypothetical protein MRB53_033888 [Persea americana]